MRNRRNPLIRTVPALLGGLMLILPAEARAQETAAETLVAGQRAITFQPFSAGGGSTIGVRRIGEDGRSLGLQLTAILDHDRVIVEGDDNDSKGTSVTLGFGPELRRYRMTGGRVVPFGLIGGMGTVGWSVNENEPLESEDRWNFGLGARIGAGAEFFPVRNVGLDVSVGVGAGLSYRPSDPADQLGLDLGTFGASLGGAFYF